MNMAAIRTIRSLLFRFGGLFHKNHVDQELSSDLESHLQFHIEDNLLSGMTFAQARRDALLKLGGLQQTTENYRDQSGATAVAAVPAFRRQSHRSCDVPGGRIAPVRRFPDGVLGSRPPRLPTRPPGLPSP